MIVEGARTDVRLMKKLLAQYDICGNDHDIVSYNANIYSLYNQMFRDMDPYTADLMQVLKEHEKDKDRKRLFDRKYSDVLLIFDLDPQDKQYSASKIQTMMKYFDESSDHGKLYINYPMVESFYHMKSIPDKNYDSYTVSIDELRDKRYKDRVRMESRGHDYSKFAVDKNECDIIIRQNYNKACMICGNDPTANDVLESFEQGDQLLTKQTDMLDREGRLFVLCTCVFYILDYNPGLVH